MFHVVFWLALVTIGFYTNNGVVLLLGFVGLLADFIIRTKKR